MSAKDTYLAQECHHAYCPHHPSARGTPSWCVWRTRSHPHCARCTVSLSRRWRRWPERTLCVCVYVNYSWSPLPYTLNYPCVSVRQYMYKIVSYIIPGHLEHLSDKLLTLSLPFGHEIGRGDSEEGAVGLCGHSLRQERLAYRTLYSKCQGVS